MTCSRRQIYDSYFSLLFLYILQPYLADPVESEPFFLLLSFLSDWDKRLYHKDFFFWFRGDSISKVREKRSTSKSVFFFNEMGKIIGQIDYCDRFLTTLVIWGCF